MGQRCTHYTDQLTYRVFCTLPTSIIAYNVNRILYVFILWHIRTECFSSINVCSYSLLSEQACRDSRKSDSIVTTYAMIKQSTANYSGETKVFICRKTNLLLCNTSHHVRSQLLLHIWQRS